MTNRLPIEPFLDLLTRTYGPLETNEIATTCGVHPSTVNRWRLDGLTVWKADEVAVRVLQIHPSYVWEDWAAMSLEAADALVEQKARNAAMRAEGKREAWRRARAAA